MPDVEIRVIEKQQGQAITEAARNLDKLDKAAGRAQSQLAGLGTASNGAQQAASKLQELNRAAGMLSGGLGGLAQMLPVAGFLALATGAGKAAIELGNLGQQVEKQRAYFQVWSGGAQQATTNLEAMRKAIGGAATESEMFVAANKFMSMGLATNADELAKLAEMAVMLGGDTRTASAAMEEFSLLLANQSILRLDTFGISGARVRERIDELQAATKGLSREQAFMQAVMEVGTQKVNALKAAGVSATTAAQDLTNAWKLLREEIAKELASPTATLERGLAESAKWTTNLLKGTDVSALANAESALAMAQDHLREMEKSGSQLQLNLARINADNAEQEVENLRRKLEDARRAADDLGIAGAGAMNGIRDAANQAAAAIKGTEGVVDRRLNAKNDLYWEELLKITEEQERERKRVLEEGAAAEKKKAEETAQIWKSSAKTGMDARQSYETAVARSIQRMVDLEDNYARQRASIERHMQDEILHYEERTSNVRAQLQERLTDLARQYARQQQDINRQIKEQIEDYDISRRSTFGDLAEQLQDIGWEREDKLVELQAKLGQAQTPRARNAVQREIELMERDYARQQTRLEGRARSEDDLNKFQHERALENLRERLAQEEEEYNHERQKAQARAEEELASLKLWHGRALDELRLRMQQEDADRAKQTQRINEERNQALADMRQGYAEASVAASESMSSISQKYDELIGKAEKLRQANLQAFNTPTARNFGGGGYTPGYASGTTYAQGGYAMVGEYGPELMYVPRGSRISSAAATESIINNHGGPVYITINAPNADPARIRNAVVDGLNVARARGLK